MFNQQHFAASRQPTQYAYQTQEQPSRPTTQTPSQGPRQQSPYQQPSQTQQHHVSRFSASPLLNTAHQPSASGSTSSYQPATAPPSFSPMPSEQHSGTTPGPSAQHVASTSGQTLNTPANGMAAASNPPESHRGEVSNIAESSTTHTTSAPQVSGQTRTTSFDDLNFSSTPPSKRGRGRPRKWAREEDRRAAEAQRRRDANLAKKFGLPPPPRPVGTYQRPSPLPGTSSTSKNRTPYIYFDKDYGHHTPGTEGALTARDVIVDWLAQEGNWKSWCKWTVPERETVCRELKTVMESHGMTEREVLSIRQQISFIQRGAREARTFEVENAFRELQPPEQRKVAHLIDDVTTPQQGKLSEHSLIKYRWPYYEKLKAAVAEDLLSSTSRPTDRTHSIDHDDLGHLDINMDLDDINNSPSTAALANTTLGQALRSVEQWRGSQEPSEQEIADVTSRANQLLGTPSTAQTPGANGHPTISQFAHRSSLLANSPVSSRALTKREAEAWELEKQQIRQRLELEKEDRKAKEKLSERELHLQSIKAFRELMQDGLSRNAAGRLVFEAAWPDMRKQMDEEDD